MKKKFCRPAGIAFAFLLPAVYFSVHAQTRTVTGTVTDGDQPLAGATVTQEGSDQVASTNRNGVFTLRISGPQPVLIIRHPEYSERRIAAENQATFNITLSSKEKAIEEVVLNAGYYNVKAKESTGSIAKVTARDIENQPVNNVLSAVQGRMAGVSITQNSGVPGGGYDVQIRGRNSLRTYSTSGFDANTPLYVVDGVPVPTGNDFKSGLAAAVIPYQDTSPLSVIDPDDIESIEVLKDADATAIYGSKGANGVVLIKTRKGRKGRTAVELQSAYGLGTVQSQRKMMNTEQYITMRRAAFANDNITQYPANAYDVNGVWTPAKYTDWQDYFLGNVATQSSNKVRISGGSDLTQFSLSGGHDEQGTVFPGDYRYQRNTAGLSLNHRTADRKFAVNFTSYYTTQRNLLPPTDFYRIFSGLAPNAPDLYKPDGSLNWENGTWVNPMAAASQTYSVNSVQMINNAVLSYDIGAGFSARVNAGYTTDDAEERQIYPKTFYNPSSNIGSERSAIRVGNTRQKGWTVEPQLDMTKKWGSHSVQALVGTSFQQQDAKNVLLYASNFPSDELIDNIASATNLAVQSSGSYLYRYHAVYGRLHYDLHGRYFLNLTGRRDGSSRFGPGRRFSNFGAVGGAWIFSKEQFLADTKWLSFGKLRGSYGTAGSDLIGNYMFYDTYEATGTSYDGTQGLTPLRLFNPDFGWEVTRKLEAALELGFFGDRLNLSAAWYRNRSSNQLVGIPLPATTGFASVQANLDATVENRGWEFTLNTSNFRGRDFRWDTSFNLTIPENILRSFPNLKGSTYARYFEVGRSTSLSKLYEFGGVNPATGIYRFTDVNGDGKLDVNDRTVLVDMGVHWYGGLQNNFTWKSWSLQTLLQFSGQTRQNMIGSESNLGPLGNRSAAFLNYWTPENPNAQFQMPSSGANAVLAAANANLRLSEVSVSRSAYLRLKNVALQYALPPIGANGLQASVFVQGQNLYTWTDHNGPDPEFNLAGYTPPLRVFSFGFTLKY